MAIDAETLAAYETVRDEVLTDGYSITADGKTWTRDQLGTLERIIAYYRKLSAANGLNCFDRAKIGIPYRG